MWPRNLYNCKERLVVRSLLVNDEKFSVASQIPALRPTPTNHSGQESLQDLYKDFYYRDGNSPRTLLDQIRNRWREKECRRSAQAKFGPVDSTLHRKL